MSKPLPADPEQMNEERAQWAQEAIAMFQDVTRTDLEDALCDLLCDLMHWTDRAHQHSGADGEKLDITFAGQLERARRHYCDETSQKYEAVKFV